MDVIVLGLAGILTVVTILLIRGLDRMQAGGR